MDPLIVIKSFLMHSIDTCEFNRAARLTLREIEFFADLFIENNYAYKGVELCDRMLMIGGWSEEFRKQICDVREKFELAQNNQIWGK